MLSSKPKSSSSTPKKLKSTKKVKRTNRKGSDNSDLVEDDINLVTVKLDVSDHRSDRRLSQARELIASGRPISVHLEATDANQKEAHTKNWNDESRERWKEQLGLMRQFYDWEEIPMDFFVDNYVGGQKGRRLSIQISTVDGNKPTDDIHSHSAKNVSNKFSGDLKHTHSHPLSETTRTRAASLAVPDRNYIPHQPDGIPTVTITSIEVVKKEDIPGPLPVPLSPGPSVTEIRPGPPVPPRKPRAASVAIGESFPAVINANSSQKKVPLVGEIGSNISASKDSISSRIPPSEDDFKRLSSAAARTKPATASGPTEEEFKRMSLAAARTPKSNNNDAEKTSNTSIPQQEVVQARVFRDRSESVQSKSPENSPRDRAVSNVIEEESRPRRPSQTNIDQVYGRLGKPSGANDRFEVENPLNCASHPENNPRRNTVSDKKPEQFKNLTPVIDSAQFASGAIRRSLVDKPHHRADERYSTTSTLLESKSSDESKFSVERERAASDWL